MAVVAYSSSMPTDGSWLGWRDGAWNPGVSPLVVFDPVLNGFVTRPTLDAQLLVPTAGPFAGMVVRLMGQTLSIAGDFTSSNPLPFTGTITGIRIYDRYEDLLVFDDPNNQVLTRDNVFWDGVLLAEAGGLAIDSATLGSSADLSAAILAAFAGGDDLILGSDAGDLIEAGAGDDRLQGGAGNDTIDGGAGTDTAVFTGSSAGLVVGRTATGLSVTSSDGIDLYRNVETFEFTDRSLTLAQIEALIPQQTRGTPGPDRLTGDDAANRLEGLAGNDTLVGDGGNDSLYGGDGTDTLNGGAGDDFLFGGDTGADLRDVIFGGDGNDSADGGAGNDELNGGAGRDTLQGGLGSDTLVGNEDDDLLSGAGGSDLIFGNAGNDYINGGFGYDRINGGTGADLFFHLGVADHGSDWIQDYSAAQGDRLVAGIAGATASQFQVNIASTVGAGQAGVAEAFVIYRPSGQVLWALVDGAGQSSINLQIGGQVFDLMA